MSRTRDEDMRLMNQWVGASIQRGAIAVLTHRNGDMDTVGSACALARIIGPSSRACGIHLSTIAREMVKKTNSDFLMLESEDTIWPRNLGGVIIVDAASPSQLGVQIPDVPKCIVDHHSAGESFEINDDDLYINWDSCSTAEIVHTWAELYAKDRIDDGTRKLLLAGIITDTGRFRHADSNALMAASKLSEGGGVDYAKFIEDMESVELNHSQKVAITKALSRVQTLDIGQWFLSYTRAGTNEGIVARSLLTAGADISLVSRKSNGETRLTARATQKAIHTGIHLGELMQKMVERSGGEGGGHAGAAGWTGPIDSTDATSGFIALLMDLQGAA